MTVVTVRYAQSNLDSLLAEVEAGGEVVIARDDKPVARLVGAPVEAPKAPRPKRRVGMWKDREGFGFSETFFDPLPDDELALWNGEGN